MSFNSQSLCVVETSPSRSLQLSKIVEINTKDVTLTIGSNKTGLKSSKRHNSGINQSKREILNKVTDNSHSSIKTGEFHNYCDLHLATEVS
jgi:hypothetical protein